MSIESDTFMLRRSRQAILKAFRSHERLIASLLPVQLSSLDKTVTAESIFTRFRTNLQLFSDKAVIDAAARDAADFVVPEEFTHDVARIERLGSVAAVVREDQAVNIPGEINDIRFMDCASSVRPGDSPVPNMALARQLASTGSQYCVLPTMWDNLSHEVKPLRPRIAAMGNAILKHAVVMRAQRKGLLLDVRQMPEGPEAFFRKHRIDTKCQAHQTAKYKADGSLHPPGRFLQDLNEDPDGQGHFIHAPVHKEMSVARYGKYQQRQLVDHLQDVYDLCVRKGYQLSDMRAIVEDNKGAFNCIRVDPDWVTLVCMRVSKFVFFIPTYNGFGITSTPSIWDYVALVVDYLIWLFIFGVMMRWVDDRILTTHKDNVEHDHEIMIRQNTRMYGPNPFDTVKTQVGAVVVYIGYLINYQVGTVAPSAKGLNKLLVVFFALDISSGAKWPIKLCQKVASLADRYSQVILGMRGFVYVFHSLSSRGETMSNKEAAFASRQPQSEHRFAVILWRCVIITMMTHPGSLDVPIFSLVNQHASPLPIYHIESDAYNKIGIKISCGGDLIAVSSFVLPFTAPEADYQNCKEFMGILLGIIILKVERAAPRGTRLSWTSDSRSALSWISKKRAKSLFAQRAYTAYAWLLIVSGYVEPETVHAAGASVQMKSLDDLSRLDVLHEYAAHLRVDMSRHDAVVKLFQLCSPTLYLSAFDSCQSHIAVFTDIATCIQAIVSPAAVAH